MENYDKSNYIPFRIALITLNETNQQLIDYLEYNKIETRTFFYPLHLQPCYKVNIKFKKSKYYYDHGICLPSYATLKTEEIEYICTVINKFYNIPYLIYFAKAWGFTSKQLLDEYKHQSPGNTGIWDDFIKGTDDIKKANLLIIQDFCEPEEFQLFNNKQRLYFSREALDRNSYNLYKKYGITDCSFWNKKKKLFMDKMVIY